MHPSDSLMSAGEYTRVLRPLLPAEVFLPSKRPLIAITGHLLVIACCYFWLRSTSALWVGPVTTLIIGHSLGCLGFLAHDVSHGSVIREATPRWLLEMLLFGLNGTTPTVWRRVHNQTHHAETNTVLDPDRPFRRNEATWKTILYNRVFYPNDRSPLRQALWMFHLVAYIARNTISALLPGQLKLSVVPYKPTYCNAQKISLLVETLIVVLINVVIWHAVGGDWWRYLWASPIAMLGASSLLMLYIFTNHFLNPLYERTDPVVGSTSVIVPRWMDWLHDYFSYHTEHHLFPSMGARHYPKVCRLLQEHFPERYNRIPLREAWERLWRQDEFIRETSDRDNSTI